MRHQDWSKRLRETIQAAQGQPFLWGENDCCLFAADCCVAVCGVDPAEPYRGKYKTERGAKGALRRIHGSLEAAWDARFERVDVRFRQRGDVVLFDSEFGRCVGVVWSGGIIAVTEDGAAYVNAEPTVCWRVESE
ncbi:hypothetical protein HW452_05060 [Halomonas aquamarina]|uniref:Uncharacterized protein n=1 Tax=Vreelandella aquamarina TaxID=77097 RepID=A0ACC5VRN4_9GAMM|nr:hypothetical protein [Halomonas aquamarina]MBZ5486890.1 hypothetical protein [Halomonas aquamarina]